jgi:hypothetical protein
MMCTYDAGGAGGGRREAGGEGGRRGKKGEEGRRGKEGYIEIKAY